jgi:hypothetical protein
MLVRRLMNSTKIVGFQSPKMRIFSAWENPVWNMTSPLAVTRLLVAIHLLLLLAAS